MSNDTLIPTRDADMGIEHRAREITGYELKRKLGSGSYGDVWEARTRGGRPVALKVIDRRRGDAEARLELAALDASVELNHPFLLKTTETWTEPDLVIIAMELADGTLRQRLDWCRVEYGLAGIPADELVFYIREAAQALDYLHGRGKLHRDVKPDNILLVNTNAPPAHAKVGDIGLLRDIGDVAATMTTRGTPPYIAPEAWSRSTQPASDQFSLAVTYVELRQGKRPFPSEDLAALVEAIKMHEPDLPGMERAEREAVKRALHKDPARRHASCMDFAQALERALGLTAADYKPGVARIDLTGHPAPSAEKGGASLPLPTRRATGPATEPASKPGSKPARAGRKAGGLVGVFLAVLLGLGAAGAAAYWVCVSIWPPAWEFAGEEDFKRGLSLLHGLGAPADPRGGVTALEKAAGQGHPLAKAHLAWCLHAGRGAARDERRAADLAMEAAAAVEKSAAAGKAEGQRAFALLLTAGLGVEKNEAEGLKWMTRAGEQGLIPAMMDVGDAHGRGAGRDDAEAVRWYRKAADLGHAAGQLRMALAYWRGAGVERDDAEAVRWSRLAAENHEADAKNLLGLAHVNGRGVEKDVKEGARWHREAAEAGHVLSMTSIGLMYRDGRGVVKDDKEAAGWLRKAADAGHAPAQDALGTLYTLGRGVDKDDSEAVKLYRAAANKGLPQAQYNLAYMYEHGRGVEKDRVLALGWYRKAAGKGYAGAKAAVKRLGGKGA